VDREIEAAYKFIEDYFKDERTVYVMTADHGMSSLGSHGDGNPENTRTPLVVWGAGAQPPSPALVRDEFLEEWGLGAFERKDVEQADIAPLMVFSLFL